MYVRYADNLMVLCRSTKAAERTLARIGPFIKEKLFLQINVEKTEICRITDSELNSLGFGFWAKPQTGGKPLICDRPHRKSLTECKAWLRELTSRSHVQSLDAFGKHLRRSWSGGLLRWGEHEALRGRHGAEVLATHTHGLPEAMEEAVDAA